MDSGEKVDEDSEKEIDTIEIEEEDWIEYIKRSTVDALDKMERAKIRCWNRTHKKMKWKLALRIATSPSGRWLKKAAEWNPDLSSRFRKRKKKNLSKERFKTTIIGSTLQKIGKHGLDLKENTQ